MKADQKRQQRQRQKITKFKKLLQVTLLTSLIIGLPVLLTVWFPTLLWGIAIGVGAGFSPISLFWAYIYFILPSILLLGGLSAIALCEIESRPRKKYSLLVLGVLMIIAGSWVGLDIFVSL